MLNLNEQDQLLFDQFDETWVSDPEVAAQAQNNTIETFRLVFDRMFIERRFMRPGVSAVRLVAAAVTVILGTISLAAIGSNGVAGAASTSTSKHTYDWGQNILGNGANTSPRPLPVSIKGLTGANSVSTSDSGGVALMDNGTVKTWGLNDFGQLGIGSMTPSNALLPIQVPGLSNVTAVSKGGSSFAVALLNNGTVEAWGANMGALGDGIAGAFPPLTDDSPEPVVGLTGVTAISAGAEDSLALLDNGTVMTWGGFDTEATPGHNRPVPVEGLTGVKAVAAGGLSHNLALLNNGTVVAWGAPGCTCDSQPGTGANRPVPIELT